MHAGSLLFLLFIYLFIFWIYMQAGPEGGYPPLLGSILSSPPGLSEWLLFLFFSDSGIFDPDVRGGPSESPTPSLCVGGLYCEWLMNLNIVLTFVFFSCFLYFFLCSSPTATPISFPLLNLLGAARLRDRVHVREVVGLQTATTMETHCRDLLYSKALLHPLGKLSFLSTKYPP